ncbi:ABC transporter ATP-binding protein [Brevibacterium senegalense]|uniref:ABC transporter ATP-binding protein n=1 Tax=Brevibacterium senegalense TaxID=1033736 RepID=UPI0002F7A5AC|nr:ABC transporter ATP-binding protein [Brevibacterium senegalense]
MATIVATENLSKRYGKRTVVEDLNLYIPEGEIYGFLGPNGSGKSTTMKMLLSLVQPSSGGVEIMGKPMDRSTRREHLGRIGSLIESPPGYGHLTGRENMRIIQRLLGLNDQQIEFAIATVRMQGQMDKKVRNYSLGMKQRLGIAMALAREPKLLILDEPTNGLDPAGIEEMRELLRTLADGGVTVMVSSHLLGEIDKSATMLGILSQGRMIFQGTRDELFSAATPDVLIRCDDPSRASELLANSADSRVDQGEVRVTELSERATAGVIAALVSERIAIYEVRRDEQTLEQVFMGLTEGGGL